MNGEQMERWILDHTVPIYKVLLTTMVWWMLAVTGIGLRFTLLWLGLKWYQALPFQVLWGYWLTDKMMTNRDLFLEEVKKLHDAR